MHPDLIARTCGSIGVLGALVFVGVLDTPKFIVTPSQNFESVLLSINVAPNKPSTQEENKQTPEPTNEPAIEETPITKPQEALKEPPVVEQPKVEPPPVIKDNPTKVVKVDEPPPIKEEPKVVANPIKPPEPKKAEKIKEKPSVKPQAKSEPKPQPKPKPQQPNKAQELAKAKAAAQAKAQAAAQAAAKAAQEAQEKSLLEASARKLNAQLASLLVKEIRSKLRYPRNAVRRKLEGTVMVEFVIQNGVVTSYKIEKSSGHKILDEAASKLAKSLVKFNTRLDAMSNRVLIPIKYELL